MQVEGPRTPDGVGPGRQGPGEADVLAAFGHLLDLAQYAAVVVDGSGTVVLANPGSARIFRCRPSQLVGLAVRDLVPTWTTAWPAQARARRHPSPLVRPLGEGLRVPAVRTDGASFEAELLLAPLDAACGSSTIVVVKDLALRHELLGGEEHLALSQQVARMGSWDNDLTTGEVRFSGQLYRLLNIEPGSLTPQAETVFAQVHPADLPRLLSEVRRARSQGGGFFAQVRLMPRPWSVGDRVPDDATGGDLRVAAVQGWIELDPHGRPVRTFGTVQDVTERITLERALHASDRRFQAAFDQAPIGMALFDGRPGRPPVHLMVNAALSQLTGRCAPDLLERTPADLVHPPDRPRIMDLASRLSTGAAALTESVDVRLARPDGVERSACLSGTLVRDDDGTPDYVVAHFVDVTERCRREADIRQQASRDQRIAGILQHDLMPSVPHRLGRVRAACRYRPAGNGETICGDWVDVFALSDERVGVVVGDVAGHGIGAAATMTRLRTAVHLLATSGVSPAGVMRRLNETLHETAFGDEIPLATLVHAQLDPTTGTLVYSSAGHLPMLTLAGGSAGHRPVTSPVPAIGGPPIGVIPGWKYTEQAVVLDPGSVLIGYTDGLIERRSQDLDESILALLAALDALPAATTEDVESLADAILARSQPGPTVDDVAVVVLAFDPPPRAAPGREEDRRLARPTPGPSPRRQRTIDLDDVTLPPDRWA